MQAYYLHGPRDLRPADIKQPQPGPQEALQADYKRELQTHFGIEFNDLYAITNLPVSRFASWLRNNGKYEDYLQLLVEAFNPATVQGLMCRDTLNISWLGEVFDCDFNQMMNLPLDSAEDDKSTYLGDIDPTTMAGKENATGSHCFGCTAGTGSSCSGSIEETTMAAQ